MDDILAIISDYEKAYSMFVHSCIALKEEDQLRSGVCGFWSPKQVVDHFTGWGIEALENFKKIQAGEKVDLEYDDDIFNARAVAERSKLTWKESLKDMEEIKTKIVDFVTRLSEEDLSKSTVYASWINGIKEDYQLHNDQLLQWV
jgi:hypothetical protein